MSVYYVQHVYHAYDTQYVYYAQNRVLVMAQINSSVGDKASVDPFYSDANMSRIRAAIRSVEKGESALKEHELIEDEDKCGSLYRAQ